MSRVAMVAAAAGDRSGEVDDSDLERATPRADDAPDE
jgi:hypothetical protein